MRKRKYEHGFTLIEVMIATILIGIAIAALVGANASLTRVNGAGTELSTAEFLIEQVRERTTLAAYGNLYDFDDVTYSPPQNANGADLIDFAAFDQNITVENVSDLDFEQVVADHDPGSHFIRVTVKVSLNSQEISSASWLRAEY